ncbi:MAG: TRAP transporter substrate-binding protein DctP [Gammaproteobacteria bacterium]|nr:TRAP transporter substrate-binding protein DctP [Gammaproteobacteria bacterium]
MKDDKKSTIGTAKSGNRRGFMKSVAAIGGTALLGTALLGAPMMANAKEKVHKWKIQTTWDAGTTGYTLFKEWCDGFEEKSGGKLIVQAFPAKSVAADNNALFEAVKTGVLQGMNPFTLYWAGKMPATVFLSSYPAGPDQPAQWDTMFYSLGMLEMAREIYAKQGLVYVGPIHHDANIIHSKKPIHSLKDLKGLKLRVPGGMVSEVFQSFGASTVSLPGSDIFPALEKGTIDAADYVGPAVNWDLGFGQVTNNILFGPPGMMSIYQPVDLMDLTVNKRAWSRLSPELKKLVEEQVKSYSLQHYTSIQARNVEALAKFKKAGSKVQRLSVDDLNEWRRKAIPIWYKWANKDADAKKVFKLQLDYMQNDIMGYVTADDIKGLKLK